MIFNDCPAQLSASSLVFQAAWRRVETREVTGGPGGGSGTCNPQRRISFQGMLVLNFQGAHLFICQSGEMVWNYVKRCFTVRSWEGEGRTPCWLRLLRWPLPVASTSPFHVTNLTLTWPPSRKTRKKASGSRELGSTFSSEDWMLANMASLKK